MDYRSNRWFGKAGRLLLFIGLHEQSNNANDQNTYLNQIGICNHWAAPPFYQETIRGQEAPLIWSGELTACRLSVAPRIENTTGFGKIQGLAARGWSGICSVAATQEKPLFVCGQRGVFQ